MNIPNQIEEDTREKYNRKKWVSYYTISFTCIGIFIIFIALTNLPMDLLGLLFFTLLAFLAEIFSVELFSGTRGSRVSVTAIVTISGILLFGPLPSALIGMVGGIAASLRTTLMNHLTPTDRASFFQRSGFNIGMLVVSTTVAGYAFMLTGGQPGSIRIISNFIPLFIAVITNVFLNILILIGVLTIQTKESPIEIWKRDFQWSVPIGIIGGFIGGGALALAYSMFNLIGLLVFFLPVLTISYAFRLYVSQTKKYVAKLESMNIALDEVNMDLLETLGAVIDAYDVFTYGHSAQIAIYVDAIANEMDISQEDRSLFVKTALIHDIGKVGVTEDIVGKQGMLTDEELHLIQRHPEIGADIIQRMSGLKAMVPLVRHHHERWDGKGYPSGLAGEKIPLGARIIALADSVDAMFSQRPYRHYLSFIDVVNEVKKCSGTQFDPKVVDALLSVVNEKGEDFFKDSATTVERILIKDEGHFLGNITRSVGLLKKSMLEET